MKIKQKSHKKLTFNKVLFLSLLPLSLSQNSLAKTDNNDFFEMSLIDLVNYEVYTAGKSHEKIKDIPASVYIVTRNEIETYGYQTLTDLIENIPGVYNIYNYNGASGNFGTRGFWNPKSQNSSVVILVNGIKQITISDNDRSYPLEKINLQTESIDRIEFIKGPMGVIYGNGASFGVINIITNKRDDNFASLSSGTLNTSKAVVRYSNGDDNKNVVINASTYKTAGLDNKLADMMSSTGEQVLTNVGVPLPPSDYTTKNLLEHESNYINISSNYNNWYFDISYNQSDVEAFLLAPPVEEGDTRDTESITTLVGYKTDITKDFNLDLKIIHNDYERFRDFDGILPGLVAEQQIDYKSYDIELTTTYQPSHAFKLVTGIDSQNIKDYNEFTNVPLQGLDNELVTFNRKLQSIYSQATYQHTDQLLLIAGLRYEKLGSYTRTFTDFLGEASEVSISGERGDISNTSPRLSAIYTLNENNLVKLMYGKATRLSDDTVSAEITETYEINYLHTQDTLYTSMSLFHNKLDNLLLDIIFLTNGGIDGTKSTQGEISTTGIELISKKEFNHDFEAEIGLTLQNSEDHSSGTTIDASYSPDTLLHLKSAYKHNNNIYSIRGRYVASMLSFLHRTSTDTEGTYIGNESGSYTTWDFNVRFTNIASNIDANISIQNLFDTVIRYPNNLENNQFMDLGTIGPERTILGTINWRF